MTLPAHVCRCHDAGCPEKTTCLRWLEHDNEHDPMSVHSPSLFPYDIPLSKPCPMKIERKDNPND